MRNLKYIEIMEDVQDLGWSAWQESREDVERGVRIYTLKAQRESEVVRLDVVISILEIQRANIDLVAEKLEKGWRDVQSQILRT